MTLDEYNAFCAALPATTHVVQWGGQDVWKVGGKLFAVASHPEGKDFQVTFKVGDIAFDVLPDMPGLRPAPYLASRGMKWLQWMSDETLSEEELKAHIEMSYRIVGSGLTKKLQRELGLLEG